MGWNVRLDEHHALLRIETGGQPVEENVDRIFFYARGVGVVGGQGVPVGDEEEALVLVLHANPVFERADVVAEMQLAGGTHSAEDTFFA